jgi:hypothetical protein
MIDEPDHIIAILMQALAVSRGMLYSARSGDASQREIEAILDSTGQASLTELLGEEALRRAMHLSENLPSEDRDTLLGISDHPYDSPRRITPSSAKLKLIMECLISAAFSKDEEKWLFAAGNAVCLDPAWPDYIYWPDRHGLDGSVDAAVVKAMAYQVTTLPDAVLK